MKFIIDSANTNKIKKLLELNITDGITTNPTILHKEGKARAQQIVELSKLTSQTIYVQLVGNTADQLVEDYKELSEILKAHKLNYVIKIAINREGVLAIQKIRQLSEHERFLGTTIYTSAQAILAVTIGCESIAPYYNRILLSGNDPHLVLAQTRDFIDANAYDCTIIAASLKNDKQIMDALSYGAHTCTVDADLLESLLFDERVENDLVVFEQHHKQYNDEIR